MVSLRHSQPVDQRQDIPINRSLGLWTGLKNDPVHIAEVAVLKCTPLLAGGVERWLEATLSKHPETPPEQLAKRVLMRSAGIGRRGGAITGSSFYFGMVPALVMIYCEQLVVILRIAALFGNDPWDAQRVAEVLVIQQRYHSVDEAAAALQRVGSRRTHDAAAGSPWSRMVTALRQVPSMLGMRFRKLRSGPLDLIVTAATWAAYVVPVVSIPAWAVSNARATRRVAKAAIGFYSNPASLRVDGPAISLPPPPRRWRRWIAVSLIVLTGIGLGILAALIPTGHRFHHLSWLALALAELCLVVTLGRVLWITRSTVRSEVANATSTLPPKFIDSWSTKLCR